jgi:hypothetical protein
MIERIYQRTRGMAEVSRRLFAQVRDPSLRVAWAVADRDPFVLLEDELARIIGLIEQTIHREPGQLRAAENRVRSGIEGSGFGNTGAEFASPPMQKPVADRQSRYSPRQFSHRQVPSLPLSPASERTNLHPAGESVSKPPAARQGPMENVFVRQRKQHPAFPQFTYGEGVRAKGETLPHPKKGNHRNGPALSLQHSGRSSSTGEVLLPHDDVLDVAAVSASDTDVLAGRNPASASLQASQQPNQKSRLIQTSGLIHLLKKNTTPAKATELHSSAPVAFPEDAADQQPALSKRHPAPALTVEDVLEELEDRLRFEFLRTYGSSGE